MTVSMCTNIRPVVCVASKPNTSDAVSLLLQWHSRFNYWFNYARVNALFALVCEHTCIAAAPRNHLQDAVYSVLWIYHARSYTNFVFDTRRRLFDRHAFQ